MSPEAIAALGSTYVGYNPHLIQSLAQQTADYRVGAILLLVAFSLQMGNTLWPIRWKDFAVSRKGAALAVAVGLAVLPVGWWLANWHGSRIEKEVRTVYEQSERRPPTLR